MQEDTVRIATTAELPAALSLIDALLQELGEEGEESGCLPRERLLAELPGLGDRHLVFVAFDAAGTLVGVLTLGTAFAVYAGGAYGIINEMYVVPGRRSSRIGGLLLDAATAHGRGCAWRRIDVTAPESVRWTRTRAFYERYGFVFTGPKLRLALEDPQRDCE